MAQKQFKVYMKFYDKNWRLIFVICIGKHSISAAENRRQLLQHYNSDYIVVASFEEILPVAPGDFLGYDNPPF